jgi:DNA polymerase III alpha subunit
MWNETNTEAELIEGILRHGPEILDRCQPGFDIEKYANRIQSEYLKYPCPKIVDCDFWFIPDEYKNMDIDEYLVGICPKENYDRLLIELELFHKRDMAMVLKAMKYIVDTLEKNNIVWGVGRGSSVASYVLFLLGVHDIDSVKYSLPIEEFFKGEQNG